MRSLTTLALLAAFATSAIADETSGTILAYDRLDNVIVLTDKTHWQLSDKTLVPADLKAGDKITLTFTTVGDSGAGRVTELTRE